MWKRRSASASAQTMTIPLAKSDWRLRSGAEVDGAAMRLFRIVESGAGVMDLRFILASSMGAGTEILCVLCGQDRFHHRGHRGSRRRFRGGPANITTRHFGNLAF